MNFETFFTFVVNNSVLITQWLIVCVFATAILYLGLYIFAKDKLSSDETIIVSPESLGKNTGNNKNSNISPISPSVDEIMAQPGMKETSQGGGKAATVASTATATNTAALDAAQQELQLKDMEITKLKHEIENAKGNQLDNSDMKAKIQELEAKLAEYEILEDDIADLSKFKEENAKLKSQIESLKGGGESIQDEDETAVAEVSSNDVVEERAETPQEEALSEEEIASASEKDETPDATKEELSAELEETLEKSESSTEVNEDSPLATEVVPSVGDEADFVAEFEAAVQQQKVDEDEGESSTEDVVENDKSQAQEVLEPKETLKTSTPAIQDGESDEENSDMPTGDDILAEFTQSLGGGDEAAADAESSSGLLDTDKMLEEMADLASASGEGDDSALEEEMDTEKMAVEATKLLNGE